MVREGMYEVYMPLIAEGEVANLIVKSEKGTLGRKISADLSSIARGKLGDLIGKITEIKDDKVIAEPCGITLYASYIQRFVRRGTTKIDDSFVCESADKRKLRVKPVMITRKRVKRSVHSALVKETRDFLEKSFAEEKMIDIFLETLSGEMQRKLSKKLKRVYPLSFCEIRELLVEK